jgi:hypothetical protein
MISINKYSVSRKVRDWYVMFLIKMGTGKIYEMLSYKKFGLATKNSDW